jgi:hypothetical protein
VTSAQLARNPHRDGPVWRTVRLAALFGITLTGIVYSTVLAKVHQPHGWQETSSNMGFHHVVPIMMVLDWLLFGPRPRIEVRTIALPMLWPVAWAGYILIYGAITKWYRYPLPRRDHARLRPRHLERYCRRGRPPGGVCTGAATSAYPRPTTPLTRQHGRPDTPSERRGQLRTASSGRLLSRSCRRGPGSWTTISRERWLTVGLASGTEVIGNRGTDSRVGVHAVDRPRGVFCRHSLRPRAFRTPGPSGRASLSRLGGDAFVHVAEWFGPLGVVVRHLGQLEPGVGDHLLDGPVEVAATRDAALERGEPILPAGHRGLW